MTKTKEQRKEHLKILKSRGYTKVYILTSGVILPYGSKALEEAITLDGGYKIRLIADMLKE